MNSDDFVLEENSNGEIMAGGYVINDRLLIPSMKGGNKNENGDIIQPKYAIPAGLYYLEVSKKENPIQISYQNNDVLSDEVYDALYDNAMFVKTTTHLTEINQNNAKNLNKSKNTKKRKSNVTKNNKKSRKSKR